MPSGRFPTRNCGERSLRVIEPASQSDRASNPLHDRTLLSVRPLVAIRGFGKLGGVGVVAIMHEFCNLPRNLIQHRGRGPLMA